MLRVLWARKKLLVLWLGLAAAAAYGWFILQEPISASAVKAGVPVVRSLRGGAATYIISPKRNGGYEAYVSASSVSTGDTILPAYRQANLTLAKELIGLAAGEVPVTITFAVPFDLSAVQALIVEKGIRPRTLLMLGTDNQGDKSSAGFNLTAFKTVDEALLKAEEALARMRARRGLRDESVRVLAGSIAATPAQLGSLLDDPRIALVDVMEWEIRRDARDSLGIPSSQQLEVSVPSPYWSLKVP